MRLKAERSSVLLLFLLLFLLLLRPLLLLFSLVRALPAAGLRQDVGHGRWTLLVTLCGRKKVRTKKKDVQIRNRIWGLPASIFLQYIWGLLTSVFFQCWQGGSGQGFGFAKRCLLLLLFGFGVCKQYPTFEIVPTNIFFPGLGFANRCLSLLGSGGLPANISFQAWSLCSCVL